MNDALDIAMELAMAVFRQSASPFKDEQAARPIIQETSVSPYSEAALAMDALLSLKPHHFVSNQAIAALGGECVSRNIRVAELKAHEFLLFKSHLGSFLRRMQSSRCTNYRRSNGTMFQYLQGAVSRSRKSTCHVLSCSCIACIGLFGADGGAGKCFE
jgi:hypothetical protein